MGKNRWCAKPDQNQKEIVRDLRKLGYSVEVGHDDILVGYRGATFWYEIKTNEKADIRASQESITQNWKGHYRIVWSLDMILEDIKNTVGWQHD